MQQLKTQIEAVKRTVRTDTAERRGQVERERSPAHIAQPAIAYLSIDGNRIRSFEFRLRARIGFKALHRIASENFKTCLGDADPEDPRLVSRR
jgi:hypothetical protein